MGGNREKDVSDAAGKSGWPVSSGLWWLLVSGLVLYGVFFVYSTGYISEEYPVRATWTRHVVWCILGCVTALGVSWLQPRGIGMCWLTWCGYGASVLALALVLAYGQTIGGARRWLGLGPLMLQPAEFAKVFTLLAVCRIAGMEGRGVKRYLWLPLVAGVPFCLIALEPSFGNAFSLVPCLAAVLGVHLLWRQLWGALLLLLVVALVLGGVMLVRLRSAATSGRQAGETVSAGVSGLFRSYHKSRFASYLTASGGWNERQSMMTLASGGLTGKGYLGGTMKSLGYLPRTVAPTDFIFSVIGEEMGFLFGTLPVLALYGAVLVLGLHWGGASRDVLSCLNCVGLLTLFAVHVFVNIGMTVRLFPVIGLPLPFLSYGGSFTLAMFLATGIVYGTGRRNHQDRKSAARDEALAGTQFTVRLSRIFSLTVKASEHIGGAAKAAGQKGKQSVEG